MNRKQKICLWIGITLFVLMGLFPPSQSPYAFSRGYGGLYYRFFLDASGPVVLINLIVQWIVVSVITGGLIYTFKDKKPKNDQKR